MMKCREYIFLLTSGQLQEAPVALRMEAGVHRLMCRYCRTFARNDARLDDLLTEYRIALKREDADPAD